MTRTLHVDVYFDLICPWCWIGKSLLAQACKRLESEDPDVRVEVLWHSVQLIPDVPVQGWPYADFYERRLGSPQAVKARQAQVLEAASRAGGLPIDFTRIRTFPNTWKAHTLLAKARPQLTPTAFEDLLQRLFEAYFQKGEDLGDVDTLDAIAQEHQVDPTFQVTDPLPRIWTSPAAVAGVPFFVFDGRYSLSGAQPVDNLLAAMRHSLPQGLP